LPAFALTTDTSILTAIGNDYGYHRVCARQIDASDDAGDVFFAISTLGNSPNIFEAVAAAKQKQLVTVGMTGQGGSKPVGLCDHVLRTRSNSTPRIQEGHIQMGHIVCQLIEEQTFPKS
jgi:D-sedoheptulose 7-phosphate isomerase